MKTISIITPCYNEEDNVDAMHLRVREIMTRLGRYKYEHIFIDNHSTDSTVTLLKRIASQDENVKVIVNARNFGHIRSPMHALFQTRGDAVIGLAADFQEPPELIPEMLQGWEDGNYMVLCVKNTSEEKQHMFWLRKQYYKLVDRLSSVETIQNFTGFGLYDRRVVDILRSFEDPYPYFRGQLAEIGLPYKRIYFNQPARERGVSKNNWYTLYDIAMLGIVSHSKVPLRFAAFAGFCGSAISFLIALIYLILKLALWKTFSFGLAPMLIGVFFISSLQLVFLGLMGEYVGAIYTQVQKRPYAVELERINFEYPPGEPKKA